MSATAASDEQLEELREVLLRHPADRHPVEHATAQFHLGVALLRRGRAAQAQQALRVAGDLFEEHDRAVDHARAANMLGVALRDGGDLEAAEDAFAAAVASFRAHDQGSEHAAALYNLGLTHRGRGDAEAALRCLAEALRRFREQDALRHAAAAARERAAVLLEQGRSDEAVAGFGEARDLASRAGDRAAVGAAANGLGLAQLAADDPAEAVRSFRLAVASHPRRVRPAAYAMAQANLALGHERAGATARARLAARQALSIEEADEPVTRQATGILERVGDRPGTILEVLDDLEREDWPSELRPEVERWTTLERDARRQEVAAWVDGELSRQDAGVRLAAAYLGILLELPPDAMETLIDDTIVVAQDRTDEQRERLRTDVSRAMARFNVPQWMRLKDTFNRIAEQRGARGDWG